MLSPSPIKQPECHRTLTTPMQVVEKCRVFFNTGVKNQPQANLSFPHSKALSFCAGFRSSISVTILSRDVTGTRTLRIMHFLEAAKTSQTISITSVRLLSAQSAFPTRTRTFIFFLSTPQSRLLMTVLLLVRMRNSSEVDVV